MSRHLKKPAIGFIGIGRMGEKMVLNLLKNGFQIKAWNRTLEKCKLIKTAGAEILKHPKDITETCGIVLLCVYDSNAVECCVFGENGIASAEKKIVIVDHSTIQPSETIRISEKLNKMTGMTWVDAPVSGGVEGAQSGTLSIMAGGKIEDIQKIRSLMACVSSNFSHMGPVGSGQTTKIINQLLVGVGFQVIAEAVRLAETTELDLSKIPSCLSKGRADSIQLQTCFTKIAKREFAPPTVPAGLMLKDFKIVKEYIKSKKLNLPLTELAENIFTRYVETGNYENDSTEIYKMLK